jgi:SAM-dependent methyltransferase
MAQDDPGRAVNGPGPAPAGQTDHDEPLAVAERYARRAPGGSLYSMLRPEVVRAAQEWQRALLELLASRGGYVDADLRRLKLLDVGCGYGGHLLDFLRIGFSPENLQGIELLPERAAGARARLPAGVRLHEIDASRAAIADASQDLVFQSVVFSSLLDPSFQQRLADAMWRWLKPGGAVLWYDFTVDNPRNPDVRGVPLVRVRALVPQGRVTARRVTLAPPLARAAVRVHPALYTALNALPLLRTHVLAWIEKPAA